MRYYFDTNIIAFYLFDKKLDIAPDHNDPNDHMIIAQSLSDKIPIISSDKKFKHYESQGLQLVLNKR